MGTRRIRKFPITVTEEEAQRLVDTGIALLNVAEQRGGSDEWEPESLEDVQEILECFLSDNTGVEKVSVDQVIELASRFVKLEAELKDSGVSFSANMTPGSIRIISDKHRWFMLDLCPNYIWCEDDNSQELGYSLELNNISLGEVITVARILLKNQLEITAYGPYKRK